MDDAEIQREFDRKVKLIFEQIHSNEEQAVNAALKLLEETREDVVARIAQGGREFDLLVLRQVERSINQRIEEFNRELVRQLQSDIKRSFDLGVQLIDEPITLVTRPLIGVNREIAQVAANFSADLIKGLSDDLRSKVNRVLQRTALGALSPQEAIELVGRSLTDPGPFRSIAARAEVDVRTEVLRIQSIASQARMEAHAEATRRAGWKLGKSWLATTDRRTRPAHLVAMLDTRNQDVDADQPFIVAGEELMYPRDPTGSARNTVNCRCSSSPSLTRIAIIDRDRKFER